MHAWTLNRTCTCGWLYSPRDASTTLSGMSRRAQWRSLATSMAPPKLELRPLPNQSFVQGYPGISAADTRPDAHLTGTIAVIVPTSKGVEAAWLRVEMCKVETLPRGQTWKELIGERPMDLWQAGAGNGGWEMLMPQTFSFRLNVPEKLPPSMRLGKHSGIKYQLIASLKVRLKKGFMRKDTYETVIQDTQEFVLEKHELHSTWPIYNMPEEYETKDDAYSAKLLRNKWAFGVTDQMDVRIIVANHGAKSTKLKSVSMGIRQTVTFFPDSGTNAQPIQQKSIMLDSKTKRINKKIKQGEFFLQDMDLLIPKKNTIMSIHTAKHIEVSHSLRVDVKMGKSVMTFDRINLLISGFLPTASSSLISRIGPVPALDTTQEANPHAMRELPSVFMSENDPYLSTSVAADTPASAEAPAGHTSFAGDPRASAIFMDGGVPIPEEGANDFTTLGSATPGHAAYEPVMPQPMASNSTWQLQHVSMRPGDIVNHQGGSAYRSSSNGSTPGSERPVSAFMMTPSQPGSRMGAVPSSHARSAHATQSFSSAEQEKVRLFERARAEAMQYQSDVGSRISFPSEQASTYAARQGQLHINPHVPPAQSAEEESAPSPFLTRSEARAVDEKSRLQSHYAQMDAAQTQPPAPPPATFDNRESSNMNATTDSPSYFPPINNEHPAEATMNVDSAPPRPPKVPLS